MKSLGLIGSVLLTILEGFLVAASLSIIQSKSATHFDEQPYGLALLLSTLCISLALLVHRAAEQAYKEFRDR